MGKVASTAKKRWIKNLGQRYTAAGQVRCQAVAKGKLRKLREKNPDITKDEAFPQAQCAYTAVPGYFVCKLHGARINPKGVNGKKDDIDIMEDIKDILPHDLLDKYLMFYSDGELFNQRQNAALLSARNAELIEDIKLANISSPHFVAEARRAIRLIEGGDIITGLDILKELLDNVEDKKKAWDEIRTNTKAISQFSKVEIDRVKEMRLSLTSEQVFGIIDQLASAFMDAVENEIVDPTIKRRVLGRAAGGITRIVGAGSNALLNQAEPGNE